MREFFYALECKISRVVRVYKRHDMKCRSSLFDGFFKTIKILI